MKKTTSKTTGTEVIEEVIEEVKGVKVCKKVEKLEIDFGRVDLNLLRDKVNEIIECQ